MRRLLNVGPFRIALAVLGSVLVYQQVTLALANRRLREQIRLSATELVEPGFQMGRLTGFGLQGERVTTLLAGAAVPTLAIGISTGCGVCVSNVAPWGRLVAAAESVGVSVTWISRENPEETARFFRDHFGHRQWTIISEPVHATFKQMKLTVVPQTVSIGKDGVVRHAWPGGITTDRETEIIGAMRSIQ